MQPTALELFAKRKNARSGGFTFIELMVAVVIVAVLAVVAYIAYGRWIKRGRITEGQAFVSIMMSRQEAYLQQYGQYCDASASGGYYPTFTSGEPEAKKWAPSASSYWGQLAVKPPKGYTYFRFDVRASKTADSHKRYGEATKPDMKIPAQVANVTPHPWYYISAEADLDGKGTPYTEIRASSTRNQYLYFEGK